MAELKQKPSGSLLTLPPGLWRLKRRPYLSRIAEERSLPWGSKQTEEDSPFHHEVIREAGITLLHPIATGSFSTVWKALWRAFGLTVGIKIYEKRTREGSIALRSLPTELTVLELVKHPHLMRCFGTWETEYRIYMALEYVSNGDLLQYLRINGPVDELKGKLWFVQLTSAVKYLHDLRIAHRDIKCENILLDQKLNLRLTDFGFCTVDIPWDPSIPNSDWRKYSDYCGSQAYFCPEILMKIPYSPLLADVWSLGVVLYTILFGMFPFDTSDDTVDPRELPTSWKIPEDKPISTECISVIRRMFLLERRRVRSYELVQLEWFGNPYQPELEALILLAEKAGKTLKEIEEEKKVKDSPVQNFWGTQHPHLGKSRANCFSV